MTEKELFIALVDNDSIHPSDAIILLEGDGLNRYAEAVRLYKEKLAPKIVFSGGINQPDYGSYPVEQVLPLILAEGVPREDVILELKSLQTKQQSEEVLNLCEQNGWKKIILVGSHYHQYRAFLTFLKTAKDRNSDLVIYNSPARNLKGFADNPWGSRVECLEAEFVRIENYTAKGDLATFADAIEYQKWKEQQ